MKKVIAAAVLASAGSAFAQEGLVVGVDDSTVPVYAYQNGAWGELFSFANTENSWGMASVSADERIYFNDGSDLYYWNAGAGIVSVGTINVGGTLKSMTGLTYDSANDVLLATSNVGGDGGATPEALYSIDRASGAATLVFDYAASDLDFGGLGYDITTGRLFGTNDDSTPASGLYEIDPVGLSTSLISAYPVGESDIDALAVYGNTAYLVTDQAGDFYSIDVNNPAAGYTSFAGPFTTSEIFSGATVAEWLIPAPSSAAMLGLGGLLAARRRR